MIEIDQVSENPCIKPFRNVVERLDKLTTIEMGEKKEMYEWMKTLHKTFTSPGNTYIRVNKYKRVIYFTLFLFNLFV